MTAEEVAAFLRVHRTTLYRLARSGRIPAFKIGSDWRFYREQVTEWMKKNERTQINLTKK